MPQRVLGGSVALKAVGSAIVHKTELGAVRLGLKGRSQVAQAAREMIEGIRARGVEPDGLLVEPMVEGGVEMLVGVANDPLFGPVVVCGAGGRAVELVKDVAVRLSPLSDVDAAEMIRSLATFPLLDGYRGAPKADVPALEDLLLRVSSLVEGHPSVAEMDCNPVIVLPKGAVIVDARVRVENPSPQQPSSRKAG